MDLFRREVLEARKMRLEGEVLLSRPLRAHAIVALLALLMVGLALWFVTARYARTESVRGLLVTNAEMAKVVALRPGIITKVPVVEGQFVRKGQLLVSIELDQQYAQGSRATDDNLLANKRQQILGARKLITARTQGLNERSEIYSEISSSKSQIIIIENQIKIQNSLLESLNRSFERYKPVADKGFISQSQMDSKEQQILNAKQQLEQLKQQLIILKSSNIEYKSKLRSSRIQEDSQIDSATSSIESLVSDESQIKSQHSYIIVSPIDGIITAIQMGVGRAVDASIPIMVIVPKNAVVHAEIYAPSKAIAFVRPGDEVRLLYDSFPYQRFGSFGGYVKSVSKVALDPRQIDASIKVDEPVYRVRVIPKKQTVKGYGSEISLQPGMTLTANIILERQTFLEWILEPLHAVLKRDR